MIKALEIRSLIVFNLSFPNNTSLLYFFFFLLIIDLYLVIPATIAQISTEELVIPTVKQTNESNAEIETESATAEDRISNFQHNLDTYMSFYTSHPSNHYILFHLKLNFSFL